MGLTDFTTSNPGGPSGPSGPGGPGGPGGPPPSMAKLAAQLDDVEDMLLDLNERHKHDAPIKFRDALVRQTLSVLLSQQKPNPLLIGPAGTGKTKIVEDLARRIESKDPLIPAQLHGYTIYELPMSNLVAGAGMVGELESRLVKIVDFASSRKSKAILFIDEIHLLLDSKDPVYKKVSQILKPALARGDMRLIGATTTNEGHKFSTDPAFQRRFERLIVDELTADQTQEVLLSARNGLLDHYKQKVTITDDVLRAAVRIADENSKASMHRPDNALTLVDRTCAEAVVSHSAAIAEAEARGDDITAAALRSVTALPINEKTLLATAMRLMTGQAEKQSFDEERILDALARIKGQDDIIADLLDMLRRDDLAVFPRSKPLAWMFAGPSGVGKTEVSRVIAEELTDQEPIILNMGEYGTESSKTQILGSPPGYIGSDSQREKPFDTLESNPYRLIILDEMEKAHESIQSLMLSALDTGEMRMADGKLIDFSKSIIVATTNAAREELGKQRTGFQSAAASKTLTQQELVRALQQSFKPEFLGRFTKLIAFNKLDRDVYAEILVSCYQRERQRIMDSNPRKGRGIPADIDDALLAAEVKATYLPDQGARPAEQTARRLIEDALLNAQQVSALPQSGPGLYPAPEPVDEALNHSS